jgi:hypothetical protein
VTAIVFIDPQNEVLSEKGSAWPLVRESLQENNTIENMERIFKAAKAHGFEVFISPHYFYPTDKGWKFNGPLETDESTSYMFARKGVLNLDGFEGSGGWARSAYGETAEGISWMEHGIRDFRANGSMLAVRFFLALKAEALYLADRTSEALEAIWEAKAQVERSEERWWSAAIESFTSGNFLPKSFWLRDRTRVSMPSRSAKAR